MDRSGLQRLIPIILVLLIVILAVAALFSLGRAIFSGGSPEASNKPVNTGKQALTTVTAERSVKMTVRGPIVGQSDFHSYTITISPDSRNMTTYSGYLDNQVDNDSLENNNKAYTEFVYALSRAKLMDATPLEDGANDTRGICPTGLLYKFAVLKGDYTVQELWTSTCKGAPGSLKASETQVANLFKKQIPPSDISKFLSKIHLNY